MTAISSTAAAPISFNGLSSGLNTSEIIQALLNVEREPITRLGDEQTTLEGQHSQLQSIQSSLSQLGFDAQELGSPMLFKSSQSVSSSEPARVLATTTTGAAVGGYEVEVTQLANSAQRTFTFKSPATAEKLTIEGAEIEVAAGASAQDLAQTINGDASTKVYAAALDNETIVLSARETGAAAAGFINVSDPGGTLVEQAGLAKEGKDAEYTIDGVAGSSTSNKLTSAIPGVTLELKALTTNGPVTVDVQPPAANVATIVTQVQAFVSLYNSTIAAINTQVNTKPPSSPAGTAELQSGTLFGDFEMTGLLNAMRQAMYEPGKELPAEMSSLADIGISTGAPTGKGTPSQSAVEGQLTVNTAQLESAIESNPAGAEKMLQSFSKTFYALVNANAGPGGTLEARINGDSEQMTELSTKIANMNEMLAVRQQALQAEFEAMEKVVAQNKSISSRLSEQLASMLAADASASSSSSSPPSS